MREVKWFPNLEMLPPHIQGGAIQYVQSGIKPGDFLTAVICNNLKESFARADEVSLANMFNIVSWWYNEAPSMCWGSEGKMKNWILHRGLDGLGEVKEESNE